MALQFDIREFDEVTSTNDVVKELALAGEPEGVVVCARSQTAGYGRRGNAWQSAPGSLYMSLLLRPQSESAQIQTLPLVVAIAVRRAIASLASEEAADAVQVKWPNDVVVAAHAIGTVPMAHRHGRDKGDKGHDPLPWGQGVSPSVSAFNKICGISSELKHGALCIGIGVNIGAPDETPWSHRDSPYGSMSADSTRNKPTYLGELLEGSACPSIEQVRDAVLVQFAGVYESWQQFGFAPFRNEYMQHFALMDVTVRIEDALAFVGDGGLPAREVPCCVIKGVDEEGRLVASACDSGDVVRVTAGRVQVLHGE